MNNYHITVSFDPFKSKDNPYMAVVKHGERGVIACRGKTYHGAVKGLEEKLEYYDFKKTVLSSNLSK